MTQFTHSQQAEHCRQLIKVLENLRPDQAYYHGWYMVEEDDNECRSACALGWAAYYGIGGIHLNEFELPTLLEETSMPAYEVAGRVFGKHAYSEIFSGIGTYDPISHEVTPQETSKEAVIRKLRVRADRLTDLAWRWAMIPPKEAPQAAPEPEFEEEEVSPPVEW